MPVAWLLTHFVNLPFSSSVSLEESNESCRLVPAPMESRAVRHDILQLSARVLAIIASEILSFKEIPIEFSL